MTRLRINDKEEIKELNKRLEECKKENEMLKRQFGSSLSNLNFKEFTSRQQKIIKYIEKNPATSKEAIIKELTNLGESSRNTIFKDLEILIKEYNIIIPKKDKPNSQIYKLYVNNQSELLLLYQDLNKIENLFRIIINKITYNDINSNITAKPFFDLTNNIILIYTHILGIYITHSILKWSKEIEDLDTINKLYGLLFSKLIEIQKEISKSFKIKVEILFKNASLDDILNQFYKNNVNSFFILDPKQILKILEDFNKYENVNEINDLLKFVWKISFPIYRYSNIELIEMILNNPDKAYDLEDLVVVMKYHIKKNKINKHDTKIIIQKLENKQY